MSLFARNKWTIRLSLVAFVGLAVLYGLAQDRTGWSQVGSVFLTIRVVLYAIGFLAYDSTLGLVLKRVTGDPEFVAQVRENRLRIALWVLIIEGVFFLSALGIH